LFGFCGRRFRENRKNQSKDKNLNTNNNLMEEISEQKNGDIKTNKSNNNNNDLSDNFREFDDWLRANGAKYPNVELRDYGQEVRGCHVTKDINEEEIIINIPLKCLITVEMGKETDIGRSILLSNIELDAPKHIFLMVFMLIDSKNPNSFFKPYYNILPKTLNNMPIFWSNEELDYLQGSYLLNQIDERITAIEADYSAICSIAPNFKRLVTLKEFKWARMCVCSRNFGLIINGIRTAALVPFADMLNHYRPRETKWQFDDTLQGFTVTSVQQIVNGAQVYDSYGQKCNHRFLLNYGFSVENNVEADGFCPNEVPLLFQLNRSDPLYDTKISLWRRDSSLPSRRLRVSVCDNENSRILFALLRIIASDQDDLNYYLSTSSSTHNSMTSYRSIRELYTPISLKNEIKTLKLLDSLCNDYLSKYKNSYEIDCDKLNCLPMFSNERHAVIQVKGEKEILLFYQDLSAIGLKILQMDNQIVNNNLSNELNYIKNNKHVLIYQYIKNLVKTFNLSTDTITSNSSNKDNKFPL